MSDRFNAKMGLRYAAFNLLKLAMLFVAVVSLCVYALTVFSDSVGTEADTGGLLAAGIGYAVPFFLIPIIAFIAGGFAPGDRFRLIGRLAMCACMLVILVAISNGMRYEIHDIVLDGTTGAVATTTSLTAVPECIMTILAFVPVLSGIDAVLEHLEPSTTNGWDKEDERMRSDDRW